MNLWDLEIYRLSREISQLAWSIYTRLGWQDKKVMGDQFISAVDSVSANIAESFGRGSLKSQLRVANRLGVEVTIIIGQKETLDETAIVKDMVSGTQGTVTHLKLVDAVKKILKTNQDLKV